MRWCALLALCVLLLQCVVVAAAGDDVDAAAAGAPLRSVTTGQVNRSERPEEEEDFVLDVAYIPTCCSIVLGDDLISNEQLLTCVARMTQLTRNQLLFGENSQVQYQTLLSNRDSGSDSGISDTRNRTVNETPPVVSVVSMLPNDIFQLHSSALAINAAYAEHNKYLYYTMTQPQEKDKQRNVISLLKDVGGVFSSGDLVFWLEEDVVITDMTWRIEDIISPSDDDIDVFIIRDSMKEGLNPYQLNISCILYRNTAWSLEFFHMFDMFLRRTEADLILQKKNYLDAFLWTVPELDRKKLKILSSSSFHASHPSHLHHQSEFPLLNLLREDDLYARSVLESGWSLLCGHTRRNNLHPNPAPFPDSHTLSPIVNDEFDGTGDSMHHPLWSFIDTNGLLSRMDTIEDYPFSLPEQIGLTPKKLRRLYAAYQDKYFKIKSMITSAKQLKEESGDTPLPFRSINQLYINLLKYIQTQHPSIVANSKDDIIYLYLWCYTNLRDAFLIPVMNIESESYESDLNDLKAVVINIFRTLLEVLFKTVKLMSGDGSRKTVRQNIISEADKILTSRIKMFFADSDLREGYYYNFKLLSLQPSIEKKKKAAEYWYYLYEMIPIDEIPEEEFYDTADSDDWINFFCSLGDSLRPDKASHAAAVKYYGTCISLLRNVISRRISVPQKASNSPAKAGGEASAAEVEVMLGRLRLASALLGTVLCTDVGVGESFYTLETSNNIELAKKAYLNESLNIFKSHDLQSLSKKDRGKLETEFNLALKIYEDLNSSSVSEKAHTKKKTFKRKKKKYLNYEAINPFQ